VYQGSLLFHVSAVVVMESSDGLDSLLALDAVLGTLVLAKSLWGYQTFLRRPYRRLAGFVVIGLIWGPEM